MDEPTELELVNLKLDLLKAQIDAVERRVKDLVDRLNTIEFLKDKT